MSWDFWPFFCLKYLIWAPYEQSKIVSQSLLFSGRNSLKTCVCVVRTTLTHRKLFYFWKSKKVTKFFSKCSHWLQGHGVSDVVDYAYMCQRSQRLRRHRVGIVNDYADTFGKLWKLLTDFTGTISQKRYWDVFTNSLAII